MRESAGKIRKTVLHVAIVVLAAVGMFLVALPLLRRYRQPVTREVMAVDAIRRVGRLEVFRFSNSCLYSYEKSGTERIAEYVGIGTYSVDLERAEILLDPADNYIRIEVPDVEMPQGAFELVKVVDVHVFEQGKGSKDFGIDLYYESKKDAGLRLESEARSNYSFRQKAENNARMIIESLARKFTDLKDPEIDIVFV